MFSAWLVNRFPQGLSQAVIISNTNSESVNLSCLSISDVLLSSYLHFPFMFFIFLIHQVEISLKEEAYHYLGRLDVSEKKIKRHAFKIGSCNKMVVVRGEVVGG